MCYRFVAVIVKALRPVLIEPLCVHPDLVVFRNFGARFALGGDLLLCVFHECLGYGAQKRNSRMPWINLSTVAEHTLDLSYRAHRGFPS
jgi:hypothetical protein